MATNTKPIFIRDQISTPESRHDDLMRLLSGWHQIRIRYDKNDIGDQLLWCFEHCQGHFRDLQQFDEKIWYFENEQDAALFALKWA
jgi:hypothetical protein